MRRKHRKRNKREKQRRMKEGLVHTSGFDEQDSEGNSEKGDRGAFIF